LAGDCNDGDHCRRDGVVVAEIIATDSPQAAAVPVKPCIGDPPGKLDSLMEPPGPLRADIAAEELPDIPVLTDIKTIFLGGLSLFALLGACYVAGEIILPIVLAFVLKLVLQPAMRLLENLHLPRIVAALAIIVTLLGGFVGLGTALSGPAASWAQKIPDGLPRLEERLTLLSRPIHTLQKFLQRAEGLTQVANPGVPTIVVQGSGLSDKLLTGTRTLASGLFTTVLVLFFLLVSGDTFLRRLVEVLPRFKDKRQAVEISQRIEADISAYLATITMMNTAVGIATGIVAAACGLGNPVLWGTIAFVLNYVPILGPVICTVIFVFVGLLSVDALWLAFMPAGVYVLIHLIEGETITPMLLAKRFTINPVLIVLAIVFWYWMWGVLGVILAMPMLAVTKIICDRIEPLAAFGHFIEG
jgi:predicted PurR-regulated permease PerM